MSHLINPTLVAGGASLTVSDLLAARHRIPNYQRDFVWATPQVEQLWKDFIAHYRKFTLNEELKNPDGYFLGAMVAILNEEDKEKRYEVVDGQQRLTTLSTVLSVLYDQLQELADNSEEREGFEEVAKNGLAKFVSGRFESNIEFSDAGLTGFFLESLRRRRSRAEKEAYWSDAPAAQMLSAKRSTASKVKEAVDTGYAQLDAFLSETTTPVERRKRLISFFRLVTECVVVLRISAQSHTNAYAIFESLNNRGVQLSQADLIKNELLKSSSQSNRQEIVENWNAAKELVEANDFIQKMPDFLHLSYLSRYGQTKAKDLLQNITNQVKENPSFAASYAKEIAEDADALDMLTERLDASWTDETKKMLSDIHRVLGVKLCYPMLIAAYRKYKGNPQAFETHVRLCLNFVFRFMKVLDSSIESLAQVSSEVASKINKGEGAAEVAAHLEKKAPDQDFKKKFRELSVRPAKLAYFVVYYLEKQMLKGTRPELQGPAQNLEHIMPQSPHAQHWPEAKAWLDSDAVDFEDYLWRVGNLLPLPAGINKSVKNREISHKLSSPAGKDYEGGAHNLVSPRSIRKYLIEGKWTKESIAARQDDLAEAYACKAWNLSF